MLNAAATAYGEDYGLRLRLTILTLAGRGFPGPVAAVHALAVGLAAQHVSGVAVVLDVGVHVVVDAHHVAAAGHLGLAAGDFWPNKDRQRSGPRTHGTSRTPL